MADVGCEPRVRDVCHARQWLGAPSEVEGMLAEFGEEMKAMKQVLLLSVAKGEGPEAGGRRQGVGAGGAL